MMEREPSMIPWRVPFLSLSTYFHLEPLPLTLWPSTPYHLSPPQLLFNLDLQAKHVLALHIMWTLTWNHYQKPMPLPSYLEAQMKIQVKDCISKTRIQKAQGCR